MGRLLLRVIGQKVLMKAKKAEHLGLFGLEQLTIHFVL